MTARRLHLLGGSRNRRPEARWLDAPVVLNRHRADRYWYLVLAAPEMAALAEPGQFVMLTAQRGTEPWPVLPRPMAVYDTDPAAGTLSVLYGLVGEGTRHLSGFRPGDTVHTVGPLGRHFDILGGVGSLLLGRGIGVCSLTLLARQAVARGHRVTAVCSSRTRQAAIGPDFFSRYGVRVHEVRDSDGTSSPQRLRNVLLTEYGSGSDCPGMIAVCGSSRLLDLASDLADRWSADLQVSLEARMACGLGYCHGCATGYPTATAESPLICYDGPVFRCLPDPSPDARAVP